MSASNDAIRAATVGARKAFKSEKVTILGDLEIEVRQPSVRSRAAILKAAKAMSGDRDRMELGALQVTAVIECCFNATTGEKLFGEADRESLSEQPSGGFVDDLSEVALRLMNVDSEDIAKNSEGTATSSSSIG